MTNIVEKYGKNAGKIWKTLNEHGTLTENSLVRRTGLKKEDFYVAVGWLAKENKIYFDENTYTLGQNNWEETIGENAGKVWNIVDTCDEIDITYLPKLAGITEENTYCALGWLAREGKINTKKVKPRKTLTKVTKN